LIEGTMLVDYGHSTQHATSWFDKLWWWCQMLGKCISGIRISKILLWEDPDPPHGLLNFGARRVGLHTTWSAPQAKNPSYASANGQNFDSNASTSWHNVLLTRQRP